MLSLCDCLSVRLSHAGTVPKPLNVGSRKHQRAISHRDPSFPMPKIAAKFQRGHPKGKANRGGVRLKAAIYDQYLAYLRNGAR